MLSQVTAGRTSTGSPLSVTGADRTLPGWAGSPAWVLGHCHCLGSSSSPAPGIWKWFVEAPGKKGDIDHQPRPGQAAAHTSERPAFGISVRPDLYLVSHWFSIYSNYELSSSQL